MCFFRVVWAQKLFGPFFLDRQMTYCQVNVYYQHCYQQGLLKDLLSFIIRLLLEDKR